MLTTHEAGLRVIRKRREDIQQNILSGAKDWTHYQRLIAIESTLAWVEQELINLHRQGEQMDE